MIIPDHCDEMKLTMNATKERKGPKPPVTASASSNECQGSSILPQSQRPRAGIKWALL